jgi:hypothetical protein
MKMSAIVFGSTEKHIQKIVWEGKGTRMSKPIVRDDSKLEESLYQI